MCTATPQREQSAYTGKELMLSKPTKQGVTQSREEQARHDQGTQTAPDEHGAGRSPHRLRPVEPERFGNPTYGHAVVAELCRNHRHHHHREDEEVEAHIGRRQQACQRRIHRQTHQQRGQPDRYRPNRARCQTSLQVIAATSLFLPAIIHGYSS